MSLVVRLPSQANWQEVLHELTSYGQLHTFTYNNNGLTVHFVDKSHAETAMAELSQKYSEFVFKWYSKKFAQRNRDKQRVDRQTESNMSILELRNRLDFLSKRVDDLTQTVRTLQNV